MSGHHVPPGIDIKNGGTFLKHAQAINFSTGTTASDPGGADATITAAGGGGGSIATQDEGVTVDASATTLNFAGAGVKATGGAGTTTITISGCVPDVLANRPAASAANQGEAFFATDTGVLFFSTGASWVTVLPSIAGGGTGQVTKAAAYDALSPTSVRGDLEVRGASNNVALAIGGNGQLLISNGTDPVWRVLAAGDIPSLSGTYQVISAKGAANGYAGLDASSLLATTNSRWQQIRAAAGATITGTTALTSALASAPTMATPIVGERWRLHVGGFYTSATVSGALTVQVSISGSAGMFTLTTPSLAAGAAVRWFEFDLDIVFVAVGSPGTTNATGRFLIAGLGATFQGIQSTASSGPLAYNNTLVANNSSAVWDVLFKPIDTTTVIQPVITVLERIVP